MSFPDQLTIVRMRWWHLPEVLRLDGQLFGATAWSPENYWAELAAAGRTYLVAFDDARPDRVAGFAGLAVNGADAEVQTIAVASGMQNRGLGRRLLRELGDVARSASHLLLEVRADNDPAIGLYISEGFEQIAVRRGYYAAVGVDALVMRTRLPLARRP